MTPPHLPAARGDASRTAPLAGAAACPGAPALARPAPPGARLGLALAFAAALAACGGGGSNSNPIDNPPDIVNSAQTAGRRLSYIYYQRCINPILVNELITRVNGVTTVSTCASGGCHDDVNGTGGALRLVQSAPVVNLTPVMPPAAEIRASAMYRNFYSAQAATVIGDADASRLLNKPLVRGVLHGGGIVFADSSDVNVRVIRRWISQPMPEGEDEFSAAAAALFTPPDATSGACI